MYKYFPHTDQDIQEMLSKIGVQSLDDLFLDLPKKLRNKPDYDLPVALSEIELRRHFEDLMKKNQTFKVFRGAGAYDHYTPSIIPAITSREEFLTAYTPYQPEIAQGTLQYIFEFQSMITDITGMDVANASMYDGPTATAEAMFMAFAQTKRNRILISDLVNPNIIKVVETYAKYRQIEVVRVSSKNGHLDLEDLKQKAELSAGFIGQVPNYYGIIENLTEASNIIHQAGGLSIINGDPSILTQIASPKEMQADIACGDCQSLGIPLSFGGAYVGYLATTNTYLRKMPGRICGVTEDRDHKRGFVLTLQAREQHIRREKANSNICSNQSLMALWVTVYLSIMGQSGLKEVNDNCFELSHYLEEKLIQTGHFFKAFDGYFVKEFVLKTDLDIDKLEKYLLKKGFLSGLKLDNNHIMFAVTEKYSITDIDEFVSAIGGLK